MNFLESQKTKGTIYIASQTVLKINEPDSSQVEFLNSKTDSLGN